jgi:hypothetical protein
MNDTNSDGMPLLKSLYFPGETVTFPNDHDVLDFSRLKENPHTGYRLGDWVLFEMELWQVAAINKVTGKPVSLALGNMGPGIAVGSSPRYIFHLSAFRYNIASLFLRQFREICLKPMANSVEIRKYYCDVFDACLWSGGQFMQHVNRITNFYTVVKDLHYNKYANVVVNGVKVFND